MSQVAVAQSPTLHHQETFTLGMAHLAPQGLSEDWWLKHLGDVHWQLIAKAVGQNTTVFRDKQGRQLYAAFCATDFKQMAPDLVGLGQGLELQSDLWAAGRSRIQSNHRLIVNGAEVARFKLVSTFVAHMEAGVNASVRRATPYLIPVLDDAPDRFAKTVAECAKTDRPVSVNPQQQVRLATHVGNDFNAVGLLYFPSYTRLLDHTELAISSPPNWRPVKHRRVIYFGNIEAAEIVTGCTSLTTPKGYELWKGCAQSTKPEVLASCTVERH